MKLSTYGACLSENLVVVAVAVCRCLCVSRSLSVDVRGCMFVSLSVHENKSLSVINFSLSCRELDKLAPPR